jgi:8-oxo-dGTP pyrophosphatase MutT (NUDIX family)
MVEVTRHFSATTYVVSEKGVLLHLHKRLNKWLPVGGHIDRDELPQDAAVREVKEETGLDVDLLIRGKHISTLNGIELISPFHVMLHNLNPFHQHIDNVFFAIAKSSELSIPDGESRKIGWFTKEEIKSHEGLFDDTKHIALEILDFYNNAPTRI